MNPSDYYKHEVVNKVREPELRKVASVLADHIGQQNAITLAELCAQTNMGERQARRAVLPKTAEPQQTALFEQPKPEPWQLQYGSWR